MVDPQEANHRMEEAAAMDETTATEEQEASNSAFAKLFGMCFDGSEAYQREQSRYLREFAPAMIGYIVTMFAVMFVVDKDSDSALNYLILLPAIPVAMMAWVVYRSVQRVDEYARMIQLNSMAIGFGIAMVGLVALGLLAIVDLSFSSGPWLVFMVGMAGWALSSRWVLGRND